jgi:hypothetical protein
VKKLYGWIILLVISEALGVFLGEIFFGLFEKTVPAAVLTSFNKGTAHGAFLIYGLGAGLLIFVVGLVSAGLSRLFTGRGK